MVRNLEKRLKAVRREAWDEGVFMEVLSRLPVKSICSFKTVCNSWNGFLSEDYFAKKQLARSRENPTFITCPSMDTRMKLYSMRPGGFELSALNIIDPVERSQEYHMYMISSFNGLICCINPISDKDVKKRFCDMQIWICNPCTGETLLLPQGTPSFEVKPSVGVAYASDTSDYTVFRIFSTGRKVPEEMLSTHNYFEKRYALEYECEVYSSSTRSWRNVGSVPRRPLQVYFYPYRLTTHAFVGGKVYWLVSLDDEGEMLSVDMDGRFKIDRLPQYSDSLHEEEKITEATYLTVVKGSLALVILHPENMDVWFWQAEEEKWVIVCEDYTPFENDEIVLFVTSLGNEIMFLTETDWWTYNVDNGIWDSGVAPPTGFLDPAVFPYTESVVTCKGGVML